MDSGPETSQRRELVHKDTATVPTAALTVLGQLEESLNVARDVGGMEAHGGEQHSV